MGVALAAGLGLTAVAKAFSAATGSSIAFEAQMSRVQAVTKALPDDFEALKKAADEAGATTSFSATQAAEGLEVLGRAGLSARQSIDALQPVLAVAKAENIGLAEAAGLVVDNLSIFGLEAAQSGRVADVLATGSARANANMQELGVGLGYAGGQARAMGLDLEQTTAVLLAFAQNGLRGERAGTGLRNILGQLQDPASKAREELRKLGIDTNNLADVIGGLTQAGPRAERAIQAFGIEAGPGLRALLSVGVQGIREHEGALRTSEGAARTLAETVGDNLAGRVTSFLSVIDAVGRKLTTPILEPLKRGFDDLIARLRTLLEGGRLDQIGEQFAAAFERGRIALAGFLDRFDFEAALSAVTGFAGSVVENLGKVGTTFQAVGAGFRVVANLFAAGVNVAGLAIAKFLEIGTRTVQAFLELLNTIGLVSDETIARGKLQIEALQEAQVGYVDATVQSVADLRIAWDDLSGSLTDITSKHTELADAAEQSGKRQAEALAAPVQSVEQLQAALIEAQQRLEAAKLAGQDLGPALQGVVAAEQALATATAEAGKAQAEQATATEATTAATSKIRPVIDAVTGTIRGYTDGIKGIVTAYKSATDATLSTEQAFERLGLQSSAELKRLADEAKRAFVQIKNDGTSTTTDVANAFAVYAQRARESGDRVLIAQIEILEKVYGTTDALAQMGSTGAEANQQIADTAQDAANAVGDIGDAADSSADQLASGSRAVSALAQETERLTLATIEYLGFSATAFGEQGIKNYNELLDDLRAALDRAKSAAESLDAFDPASASDAERLQAMIAQYERFIVALKGSDSLLNNVRDDRVRDLEQAIADARDRLEEFNAEARQTTVIPSPTTPAPTPSVPASPNAANLVVLVARTSIDSRYDLDTPAGRTAAARALLPEIQEILRRSA